MKVMMLSDSYPPHIGGMEKHVSLLATELVHRKHDVTVFTIQHRQLPRIENVDGVKITRSKGFFQRIPFLYSQQSTDIPPVQDLLITRNLKELVAKERPDIIHVHGWLLFSLLPLMKRIHVPLVTSLHDYRFICPNQTLMSFGNVCTEPFTRKCLTCAGETYGPSKALFIYHSIKSKRTNLHSVDKFIAVSSFVKEVHSKHLGLENQEIVRIPNFLDIEEETSCLKKSNLLPEDFVLFVGVLAPYKGVNVLVEAYDKIDTKTKLVLIGKKVQQGAYKSTQNVIIITDPSDDIVRQAYSQCSFVIVPSIWPDPCPTVAFEAMASKKPIIASNMGGLVDIVMNKKTGLLVPPNDPSSLRIAIEQMICQSDMARKMGEFGYQRMRSSFSAEVVVSKIEKLYESLV
ncbi:MAG TPA: glycosyltransferase family 4 protein [Acidobacteriota bacterium]|nr:glycosyltransferase family 4 protein [Acidobacteriota bacterium]